MPPLRFDRLDVPAPVHLWTRQPAGGVDGMRLREGADPACRLAQTSHGSETNPFAGVGIAPKIAQMRATVDK